MAHGTTATMKMTDPSPSAARRKALRDADSTTNKIQVMDTYPIDKYFAMADRLLTVFDEAVEERRLDDAYIYGIRFASFSVESLPKHKDYNQNKHLQLRNAKQVDRVLKGLESVTARMDAEELANRKRRDEERREEEEKQEALRREREAIERKQSQRKQDSVEQSALAKLKALQMESERKVVSKKEATQAKEETTLERERQKIAEHAERLAQKQREKETTANSMISEKKIPSIVRANVSRPRSVGSAEPATKLTETKPHYMKSREYATIQLLEQTIAKEDARLPVLQQGMAMLLQKAKVKRDAGKRKEAIHCLARRKKLERIRDAIKGAIFTMETQIVMIDAAASDRDIRKAMEAATEAMESMQVHAGDVDSLGDFSEAMDDDIAIQSLVNDVMYDEDELLSELEASTQQEAIVGIDDDLLSLPSPPKKTAAPEETPALKTEHKRELRPVQIL